MDLKTEYVAVTKATKKMIWLKAFFSELDLKQENYVLRFWRKENCYLNFLIFLISSNLEKILRAKIHQIC